MPHQKYPAEYFKTPECRKKHLGGGITAWHRLGGRQFLGYREGVKVSSWYAKIEWGKNRSVSLRFGEPDDDYPCDGSIVFSFEQALEVAKSICNEMAVSPSSFRAPQGKYRRLPELPPRSPYKVVHAVMDYIDWQRAKGRATQADESVIRTSIVPHIGHIELATLSTKAIRDCLEIILKTPARITSPRTDRIHFIRLTNDEESRERRRYAANRVIRILKAALQRAFENEYCDTDIAWRRVKPFKVSPTSPPRYLERDEIHRLVSACPSDLGRFVTAAVLTGCRLNELQKIKVGDYSRTLRRIFVSDDKTKKSRHVTLSNEGREFFDRLILDRNKDDLMLTRNDGSAWKKTNHSYRLHRVCNQVGISPVIGMHVLRATFASHAVMGGVPLHVVQRQLGHAKFETTERSYLHLSTSYIDDIFAEKMPVLVASERPWHLEL